MLARPIFEYLAILLITAGLMLTFMFTPEALIGGALLVVSGIALLFKHYLKMDSKTDTFA